MKPRRVQQPALGQTLHCFYLITPRYATAGAFPGGTCRQPQLPTTPRARAKPGITLSQLIVTPALISRDAHAATATVTSAIFPLLLFLSEVMLKRDHGKCVRTGRAAVSTARAKAERAVEIREYYSNSFKFVTPDGQSVTAQVAELRKHGAGKVFREVASGAKTDRAQLRRVLDQLDAGDVLMVTRLDRLARSTRDLLNILATIADKKAGFRSLGDTWANTTTAHGRLMLTVLGGLAEFERELIRARTGEGRARAVARGQKMGRPPKLTAHQQKEAITRRDRGEESLTEIGRSYNVSAATISRLKV